MLYENNNYVYGSGPWENKLHLIQVFAVNKTYTIYVAYC